MGRLKKMIKALADEKIGKNTLRYEQLDSIVKYISFDIFDTLVFRTSGEPRSVFALLEKQLGIKDFAARRISAEKRAREKKQGREVTLREIYRSFDGISENLARKFCQKEFETELDVCRPNRRFTQLYKKCAANRKVILISDMYLTSDMLSKILENCGITGYEKLYISSEADASKRSGSLYRYVLNDLKIKPCELLHIGNDLITDYICAKRQGVRCIKIKTQRRPSRK